MKDQEKIEKTFREKLEDYKVPVAASAWAGIESALGNATSSAASSVSTLFYAAAVVVSVVFTSVLVSKSPNEKEVTQKEVLSNGQINIQEQKEEPKSNLAVVEEQKEEETKKTKKQEQKYVLKEVVNSKSPEEKLVTVEKVEENKLFTKINTNISGGYAPLKVSFDAESSNGLKFRWNFGDKTESFLNNPTHIFSRPGKYTVTLIGTDKKGNTALDTKTIEVKEGSYLKDVSNIITPNNDGRNDVVTISHNHIIEFKMTIYNESGKEIFETTDLNNMWNGKDRKGRTYINGTYLYIIKATGVDGKFYDLNGEITLLEKYRN